MTGALDHPLRHRLTLALADESLSISELARRTGINKGGVSHHLRVLIRAGLVHAEGTRTARGGTQILYRRTEPRLRFRGDRAATAAMFDNAADLVHQDPDALALVRHLRLSRSQVDCLRDHLERLIDTMPPAGASEPSYTVLVSVARATKVRR